MSDHDEPTSPWQGLWLAGLGAIRDVRTRATDAVRVTERAVDAGIGAVLHRVGIATRGDLAELERGVEALSARLEAPRPRRRVAARKTRPRTAARRPGPAARRRTARTTTRKTSG